MTNRSSKEIESEQYPEGYAEALADCTVLAANLLKMLCSPKKEETA